MEHFSHHTYGVEYLLREGNRKLFSYSFSANEKEFAIPQRTGEKVNIDEKNYEVQKIIRKISTQYNKTTFVVYLIERE